MVEAVGVHRHVVLYGLLEEAPRWAAELGVGDYCRHGSESWFQGALIIGQWICLVDLLCCRAVHRSEELVVCCCVELENASLILCQDEKCSLISVGTCYGRDLEAGLQWLRGDRGAIDDKSK